MKLTKVLLVGDDSYDMYVKAFYQSFQELGYKNVRLFAINRYMQARSEIKKIMLKTENRLAVGIRVSFINRQLIQCVENMKPELVFLYTARLIYADTIKKIKQQGAMVFVYNNDDPFAAYYPGWFWRHFRKGLKYADVGFVFRRKNIEEYQKCGCVRTEMLRAYYIKSRNYYMPDVNMEVPAVVFLGHNEKDERQDYIRMLLEADIEVGVTKRSWEDFEVNNPYLVKLENSHEKYNEMMNAAKIAIVFLSKINNDTYTTRCFEIPATRTLMVAPYTDDLASMFQEDREIVFFRNGNDFVEKIKYYLTHEEERREIAEAGYQRLMKDGHEAGDRVRFVMEIYASLKKEG